MDKITVNPLEVRGAGDIVSPKSASDFDFYNSYIQQGTDLVNSMPMTVYTMYRRYSESLDLEYDKFVGYTEGLNSFPIKATLKDRNGDNLVGKTLTCTVNGNISLSGVTNSRGQVLFNVPVSTDGLYYCTVNYYVKASASGGVGGVTRSVKVYVGELNSIKLKASANPIGIDDESALVCNVDYIVDNDTFPAPGVPISFYEEYILDRIRMFGRNVVGSGDVLPLQARVSDTDGSGIPDQPVRFYEEWEDGDLVFVNPVPVIQSGSVATVSARLSDVDGSGIPGETIMFYEEYEVNSLHVKVDKPIVETGSVVPVSASLHDVDGSRIQVAGTTVRFYEEYTVTDVNLYGDKKGIIPNEIVGLTATVKDEDGSAVPNQDVIFFEEFTRTYLDVSMSKETVVSDEVSRLSALLRDTDGSRIRNSVVEFTKDIDSTDWNISLDDASMINTVEIGDEVPVSASVYDENFNPVENVYVRFVADMIPEEMIIPDSDPEPEPPSVGSVTLVGDSNILSAYDGDILVLTATVKDENNNVMEDEPVVFKVGSTVLGTDTTNSQGIAHIDYPANGNGDVSFTATAGEVVSSAVNVEDCIYVNATEKTLSGTYKHSLYDSSLTGVQLPNNVEISFDIHTPSVSNYDYRYWVMSKSQFTGNTNYPTDGLFIDKKDTSIVYGVRTNGSMSPYIMGSVAKNYDYATVKFVINGTEVSLYSDGTLVDTRTISWIENYSDYILSMMKWSGNKTMYMKNVKIKKL